MNTNIKDQISYCEMQARLNFTEGWITLGCDWMEEAQKLKNQ